MDHSYRNRIPVTTAEQMAQLPIATLYMYMQYT